MIMKITSTGTSRVQIPLLLAYFFGVGISSPFALPNSLQDVGSLALESTNSPSFQCTLGSNMNAADANQAVQELHSAIVSSDGGYTVPEDTCAHKLVGDVYAQICNTATSLQNVSADEALQTFESLLKTCNDENLSASFDNPNTGLEYAIFPKGYGDHYSQGNSTLQLERRSCVNGNYVGVDGKSHYICNPKRKLDKGGNCPPTPNCASFCEVRAGLFHGKYQVFDWSWCPGNDCQLSIGREVSYSKTFSFDTSVTAGYSKFEDILTAGFSFGTTMTKTSSTTETYKFHDQHCGYWGVVPVLVETCGTLSFYNPPDAAVCTHIGGNRCNDANSKVCNSLSKLKKTVGNFCTVAQHKLPDGRPNFVIVPVWGDCKSQGVRLPDSQQSPEWKDAYAHGLNHLDPKTVP